MANCRITTKKYQIMRWVASENVNYHHKLDVALETDEFDPDTEKSLMFFFQEIFPILPVLSISFTRLPALKKHLFSAEKRIYFATNLFIALFYRTIPF